MSSVNDVPLPIGIHSEFLAFLESDSICRTNFEGRNFYLPTPITRWLLHKDSNSTFSRAARLCSVIYDSRKRSTETILPIFGYNDVEAYPILFAILVRMGCGHMLHIFRNSITDNHIGIGNLSGLYADIEHGLKVDIVTIPNQYTSAGYKGVIDEFDRQRWAFHPALDVLNMVAENIEEKSILPFFDREIIYQGGIAEVHQHKIHVDLVESENLRQILEPRKQDRLTGIEYYEFAVKTYLKGFDDFYKLESDSFKGLNGTKDPRSLGVVTYLGEYTRHYRGNYGITAQEHDHHIMLELGEQDLDEYLADTLPPVLNEEIIAFWESLFEIAKTLARIHQLECVGGENVQNYVGWHGNIKPDSILRVRGKFKLADFGCTRLEKSVIEKPQTTHLLGGTRTYGAPERDKPAGQATKIHSTTIDTWSLGCVFSAVATWVVLGSQGYENYGEIRGMAHKRLRQRHNNDSSISVSNCGDSFHDGTRILPAVLNWHEYLRSSCRKADTITCRVLDLVESGMLDHDPQKRLNSLVVVERLHLILIDAKKNYADALKSGLLKRQSPETLSALLKLDERAPRSLQTGPRLPMHLNTEKENLSQSSKQVHAQVETLLRLLASGRMTKSDLINALRSKIANREEAIGSSYDTGPIFELSGNAEDILELPANDEPIFELAGDEGHSRDNLSPNLDESSSNLISVGSHAALLTGSAADRQSRLSSPTTIGNRTGHRNDHDGVIIGSTATESKVEIDNRQRPSPSPLPHDVNSRQLGENVYEVEGSLQAGKQMRPQDHSSNTSNAGTQPMPAESSRSLHHNARRISPTEDTSRTLRRVFRARREIPIVQDYYRLKELWDKTKAPWYAFQRAIPRDDSLAPALHNRHITFIIDNGASMSYHWNDVTITTLASAMKVGGLDKKGLDLIFTVGKRQNVFGVTGWNIPKSFRKSLQAAEQAIDPDNATNMAKALSGVFKKYKNHDKKHSLLILTDGLWEGSDESNDVENIIYNFAKELKGNVGKRPGAWFTIQFVSFGAEENAIERMQLLNGLGRLEGCDIVRCKAWNFSDARSLVMSSVDLDSDLEVPSPSISARLPRAGSPTDEPYGAFVDQRMNIEYSLQPLWRISSVIPDTWKRCIETIAGSELSWWPLTDPERQPKPGLTRVYSTTSYKGSRASWKFFDDIPTSFAARLFAGISYTPQSLPLPGFRSLGHQAVILQNTTLMRVIQHSKGIHSREHSHESAYPRHTGPVSGIEVPPEAVDGMGIKVTGTTKAQQNHNRLAEGFVTGSAQGAHGSQDVLYLTAKVTRNQSVACTIKLGDNDHSTLQNLKMAFHNLPSSRWNIATGIKFYKFQSFHFGQQTKRCSVILHEDKERYPREVDPDYQNYRYTPRPWDDDHELPCLSGEAWYFYQNQDDCGTSVQLNISLPKRVEESPDSRFTGWGIHIQQRYSILVILIPVLAVSVITLVSTMWFIPVWLSTHENDLQNATVPVMLALTTVQFMIQLLVSLIIFRWSV